MFAVCTDYENKMGKMKELLENKYPKLITYGCSSHHMNLLEKEVAHKSVLKLIVEVKNFVRNYQLPNVSNFYYYYYVRPYILV